MDPQNPSKSCQKRWTLRKRSALRKGTAVSEWGLGTAAFSLDSRSMRHAKDVLPGGPVLQNAAAIKSNSESFR